MTKSVYLQKTSQMFPTINEHNLSDIGEFVVTLDEDAIGRLWDSFEVEYLLVSPPRKGHVVNIATKAGIFSAKRTTVARYENLCYVCASQGRPYHFSVASLTCPNCGTNHKPWIATGYIGTEVSKNRAQEIVDANPNGIHPTLNNSKEARMARRFDAMREDNKRTAVELASLLK